MSVQAMVAVMNYSSQVWGEKLILLLIANQANWPEAIAEISESDLAFDAGRTPRHLRTYLRRLEESGELICHFQAGHKTLFEIPLLPGEPDRHQALERQRDARKRTYDDRLVRIRAERERRARERLTQGKPLRMVDIAALGPARREAEREAERDAEKEDPQP